MPPYTTTGRTHGNCGHIHRYRWTAEACRDCYFRKQLKAGLFSDRRLIDMAHCDTMPVSPAKKARQWKGKTA